MKSVALGSTNSETQWVYLCGLTPHFDSEQELRHRRILDIIGRTLDIGFLAIQPEARSAEYGNCLCWPHHTKEEVSDTYKKILEVIPQKNIAGWIGFSNGGFFLNYLIQHKELEVPVISVGASGYLQYPLSNRLHLMVGKNDQICELVKKLYNQSLDSPLKTTLLVFEGGHELPEQPLQELLKDLSQ
ncbi:MAG: hypothetical protein WAM28_02250 [Chlamydiales bacterium]